MNAQTILVAARGVMARLEDLTWGAVVRAVLSDGLVTVIEVCWYGRATVDLRYMGVEAKACAEGKMSEDSMTL